MIAVVDYLAFDGEIQLAQEFIHLLRAFDFNRSGGMVQLDLQGGIISRQCMREQGAFGESRNEKCGMKNENMREKNSRSLTRRGELGSCEDQAVVEGCEKSIELRFVAVVQDLS